MKGVLWTAPNALDEVGYRSQPVMIAAPISPLQSDGHRRVTMLVVQSVLMVLLVALSSGIHAQNATVLSQLDTKTRYTGCWGFAGPSNREFAVVGEQNGLWIVETTDPTQLVEVGYFAAPFSGWRESTELNGYVYSVSENHGGLRILDVRNPDAIIDHGLALETVWTNAHTISVDPDQGHVYVNGAASGAGMYVIDIGTNPIQPQVLTRYRESYVHDCYVRDGVAYLSEIFNGRIRVLDVTNLTAVGSPDPRVIRGITNGLFSTPGALTHNCWPTADGNLLLTTDETPTGDVRIYDITNPAMSLEVGSYGATGHVPPQRHRPWPHRAHRPLHRWLPHGRPGRSVQPNHARPRGHDHVDHVPDRRMGRVRTAGFGNRLRDGHRNRPVCHRCRVRSHAKVR